LQVAPHIESSEIVVQTRLKNHGPARWLVPAKALEGGRLELGWRSSSSGTAAPGIARDIEVPELGKVVYELPLATPAVPGAYVLTAKACWDGKPGSATPGR
jgi:hypothetical protein